MATQSGQGMRNQGSMAQGAWQGNQGSAPQGVAGASRNGPRPETFRTMGGESTPGAPSDVSSQPVRPGTPPPRYGLPEIPGTGGAPQNAQSPAPQQAPGAPAPQAPAPQPSGLAGTSVATNPGPVAPGTMSPSGTPVHPDGGYDTPDGGHDWMPGYGPQMDFGGQDIRTGRAPVAPDPGDPDTVTGGARGTRAWNQAYQAHDAWIRQNLDAGLHLSDLGLTPTRGGGLSSYMRYGSYQPAGGGQGAQTPASPNAPGQQIYQPNSPPQANSGGGLPGVVPGQMQYGQGGLQQALMQLLMQGQGQ